MLPKIFFFVVLFLTSINLKAESFSPEKIYSLGIYGGYNVNLHSSSFAELPNYPICCTQFNGGNGSGINFGGLFDYYFNKKYSLEARLGYVSLSGDLLENDLIGNKELINTQTGQVVGVEGIYADYLIESIINALSTELLLNYRPIERLKFSLGLRFGFLLENTFSQSEKITTPDDVIFKDTQNRTRNNYSNLEIPDINSLQAHLSLGCGYSFPMSNNLDLIPEIKYYYAFTDISSVDWKVNQLSIGASISYNFKSKPPKDTLIEYKFNRDTVIKFLATAKKEELKLIDSKTKTQIQDNNSHFTLIKETTEKYELIKPKDIKLNVDFTTWGINNSIRNENPKIIIEEIESAELFPLLPYIFFERDNDDLKNSGLNLLTKSEISDFKEETLDWDIMSIYSNVLNIVAYRMTKNPNSKITITGTNNDLENEKDNLQLSNRRAKEVKKYLVDIWGIKEKRIAIANKNLPSAPSNNDHNEGKTENQRAEISSDDYELLRPIELKDVIKNINPPQIELIPTVDADNKIAKFEYTINQGSDEIRIIEGTGNPKSLLWTIKEKPLPLTEDNINIKLSVTDESGLSKSIEKNIKIEQLTIREKRYEMKDDKRIEKFSLILFDFDKADLKPEHRKVLDMIKERIEPQSKIIIAGYADKTGTPEYNKNLSIKRTTTIKNYLKINDDRIETKNIGSDILLFDNSSPQGRSYCRTVIITIETPVK